MSDDYAGPKPYTPAFEWKKKSYMETDMENQNNALAAGADNSINDPDWQKRKLKKGIQMMTNKPAKLSKKVNMAKSYPE